MERGASSLGRIAADCPLRHTVNVNSRSRTLSATVATVCIPVYNRAESVCRAIDSALTQDLEGLEVLVVDNCSTDGTWNAIRSFRDSRLRPVRNSVNRGMFGNFNRCLQLARGEFLRFLCSDDMLTHGTIAREVATLRDRTNATLVTTRCEHVDERGNLLYRSADYLAAGQYSGSTLIHEAMWFLAQYAGNVFNFPSGILFRRAAAHKAGAFAESLGGAADLDYWLRLLDHGDGIVLDEPGCRVVEHAGRASHELFYAGRYMRGHFELLRRRERGLRTAGADTDRMLTLMGGRCLAYVIKSLMRGRIDSGRLHWQMRAEYRVPLAAALNALFFQIMLRARRRIFGTRIRPCRLFRRSMGEFPPNAEPSAKAA